MRRTLASLTLTALCATCFGAAASAAPLSADEVSLPVVPSALSDNAACTKASTTVAKAVPWEQRALGLERTWASSGGSTGGSEVTVAVVDTGVAAGAPTLKGRVTAVGSAGSDCVGHGTFVAGLVAATQETGVRFAGVADRARILAVRGTDERGAATADSVATGIHSAAQAGAQVIVVCPALSTHSKALTAAVASAAAKDALVIAAAAPDAVGSGTASAPPPRDYWPASEPGVLSVLDIDAKGQRPTDAPTPLHADLAAPGDGVVGIGPAGKGHYIGSGASLAAAYVAGTAALVRAAHPGLSAEKTAARLTGTAYPADVPRLDPYAAVTSVREVSAPRTAAGTERPVRLAGDPEAAAAGHRALAVTSAGAAVILGVAWAAAVVRPRRRRGGEGTAVGDDA